MASGQRSSKPIRRRTARFACIAALFALAGILFICWQSQFYFHPPQEGAVDSSKEAIAFEADPSFLAIRQTDEVTDAQSATWIDLPSKEYECLISDGGVYRLTGALNGRVRISAEDQYVHIVLDGVEIESREGPALYVESANKVVITLAPNSKNYLSDSGNYRSFHTVESCIYSCCDLTINGAGALVVNGLYKDALRSRDIVKILDGRISIKCNRTGIHAADGIHVSGGTLSISTRKYGLKSTKRGPDGRGDIVVSGGNLNIIAGAYAFVCYQGDLYIHDCTIQSKSVINTYDVGGVMHVESGCVR